MVFNDCELCGRHNDDPTQHKGEYQHRLNYLLWQRKTTRQKHLQFANIFINQEIDVGILRNIQVHYIENQGNFIAALKPHKFDELNGKLQFIFTIINKRTDQVYMRIEKLYPLEDFYLTCDVNNNLVRPWVDFLLNPNEKCQFTVIYKPKTISIGVFQLPIGITFQPVRNKYEQKTIFRDLVIKIKDETDADEEQEKSPFRNEQWEKDITIVHPTSKPKHVHQYEIAKHSRVYFAAFERFTGETYDEQMFRTETMCLVNRCIKTLTIDDYQTYFHRLLWLEEATQVLGLRQYNMSCVNVRLARKNVVLDVPGLAEKRPSVLRGDLVKLRLVGDHKAYIGVVSSLQDESLVIDSLDEEFMEILSSAPNIELDVSFMLSRLQLERMHLAVDTCAKNGMFISLFPGPSLVETRRQILRKDVLFNSDIASNEQQKIAVESILSRTSQSAPYILYGPPGTGKTVTLVEAILQVKRTRKNQRILVCAPSNAACDMLAQKLEPYCKKNELFRMHSGNRNISDIPTSVKFYSNLDGEDFYMVKPTDLMSHSIVISTLHLIGREYYLGSYSPDVVFIDEAAQTTEPECDIPLALLQPGKQIVLAGDPKQLGPVCSPIAGRWGISRSLMSRLMTSNQLYEPIRKDPLMYDNNYITMLRQNYRSHKDIVHVPNELFYGGTLDPLNQGDPISNISIGGQIFKKKGRRDRGAAIEFIGLSSIEQRNGNSPSFYNDCEIDMVLKVIARLMNLNNVLVRPHEIGIIAPYIRQVSKIRSRLEILGFVDIQVGTTESFQGGERRIMIISTVRAQSDLLLYDKLYDLGFVKHKHRFNVAITRAQAKLIIIGNPYVLGYDEECWGKIIEHCEDLGSYFGVEYKPRNEALRNTLYTQMNEFMHPNRRDP